MSTVVLRLFLYASPVLRPAITVATVILWALDRVRVTDKPVFGQQESGKGPRLANGAAYCVPDLTTHTLSP